MLCSLVCWNVLLLAKMSIQKSKQPSNYNYIQYQKVTLLDVPTLFILENLCEKRRSSIGF